MKLSKHPSVIHPGGWIYRNTALGIEFSLCPPNADLTYRLVMQSSYKSLYFQTIEAAEMYIILLGHEIER